MVAFVFFKSLLRIPLSFIFLIFFLDLYYFIVQVLLG